MKKFEVSQKKSKNGKRKFTAILHEIYPDACVDVQNEVGTKYNDNGITWIRKYCEDALDTIKGMSIRVEFINEDRDLISGHGNTGVEDGDPVYEDATVIGFFTKAYIDEVETDSGEKILACIGEGEIDSQCYHNLIKKIDADINDYGYFPSGSVEIMHTDDSEGIEYLYGYKDLGRIPTKFIYSGYALLSVRPADKNAKLIELNSKETNMNEDQIKELIASVVAEQANVAAEIAKCKEDCEAQIKEINESSDARVKEATDALAEKIAEVEALNAKIEELNATIEAKNAESVEMASAKGTMQNEINELNASLDAMRKEKKIGELNSALAVFTDAQKAYAQMEIDAFNADPIASEVNSVVSKIKEGIGEEYLKAQKKVAEENAAKAKEKDVDIFAEIQLVSESNDEDIF